MKQIAISDEIHEAVKEFAAKERRSMLVVAELALIAWMKKGKRNHLARDIQGKL